jgi:hypothetical protein
MPGPGGGARGGGFGGGGSRGGGFGGGFGGGSRPGGHYHRPGGFYHRPRFGYGFPFFGFRRPYFGYGGGGCLGGMMGLLFLPVLILLICGSLVLNVIGSFGSSVSNIANGDLNKYTFEKYLYV